MKMLRITCLAAGLACTAVLTSGCYTRARVWEPAGAQVYDGTYQPAYYYDDGRVYYYERWPSTDFRSPRDERRWELHRTFRENSWPHDSRFRDRSFDRDHDHDWDRH